MLFAAFFFLAGVVARSGEVLLPSKGGCVVAPWSAGSWFNCICDE